MTREEAINIVRNIYQTDAEKEALQALIPELAESEDERIRKALIKGLNFLTTSERIFTFGDIPIEDIIAYLEKQKEQKPVEYLPTEKVYAIMTKLTELSASNLIPINSPEYLKIHQITKDVRSLLDYPIEQKPAEWSEEDEEMLKDIIAGLEATKQLTYKHEPSGWACYNRWIDWLKSLRPQPHWKPSEKQMKEWAVEGEWIWATTPPEKPGKYKVQLRYDTYSAIWNGVKWIDDASGFPIMGVFKWKPIKEEEQ